MTKTWPSLSKDEIDSDLKNLMNINNENENENKQDQFRLTSTFLKKFDFLLTCKPQEDEKIPDQNHHDMKVVFDFLSSYAESQQQLMKYKNKYLPLTVINQIYLIKQMYEQRQRLRNHEELQYLCRESFPLGKNSVSLEELLETENNDLEQFLIQVAGVEWGELVDLRLDSWRHQLSSVRESINTAVNKDEYLITIQHLNNSVVPVVRASKDSRTYTEGHEDTPSYSLLVGSMEEVTDAQEFQDSKDIQRDQIEINGIFYEGSVGYSSIISAIVNESYRISSQYCFEHTNVSDDSLGSSYNAFAKCIIQAINRTESGGNSFDILQDLVEVPNFCILRPNSRISEPLKVFIDMGPYIVCNKKPREEKRWAWGIRAKIQASMSYFICDGEDPSDEWCTVYATYSNRLALSLGMSPYSGCGSDRAARFDNGEILFQVK